MLKLHTILKQFRVLAIAIILFFAILTWDMWQWYQINFTSLTIESGSTFAAMVALSGGALKMALSNIMGKHESDE